MHVLNNDEIAINCNNMYVMIIDYDEVMRYKNATTGQLKSIKMLQMDNELNFKIKGIHM